MYEIQLLSHHITYCSQSKRKCSVWNVHKEMAYASFKEVPLTFFRSMKERWNILLITSVEFWIRCSDENSKKHNMFRNPRFIKTKKRDEKLTYKVKLERWNESACRSRIQFLKKVTFSRNIIPFVENFCFEVF